jgi:hypothetical protein
MKGEVQSRATDASYLAIFDNYRLTRKNASFDLMIERGCLVKSTIMHHRPAAPSPVTITLMSLATTKPSRRYQMPIFALAGLLSIPGQP